MKPHAMKHYHYLYSIPTATFFAALLILAITISQSDDSLLFHPNQKTSSPSSSPSPVSAAKGCNIFRGGWTPDPAAPYYNNSTCSVIHKHQNCIKYGRPDLGFLKWRWKPTECELTRFDPDRFLEVMRNKSMAFVGDSLARNHMQSLVCLLSKVEHPEDMSRNTTEHNCMYHTAHYKAYNFTISIFWTPFLVHAYETDADGPAHTGLWNLYLDEPDASWLSHISTFDYIIVSASNWFTRSSMFHEQGRLVGCHYCLVDNVKDLTPLYSFRMALQTALRAVNALDYVKSGRKIIVRTVSPSHFENGEWNKGGNCLRTRPYRRNETSLGGLERELYRIQMEEFTEAEKAARENGVQLMLMDTTEAMLLRPDGHPSRYGHWAHENVTLYNDCVHWCLPGPIDIWSDMLLHMLLA